jgi:hypothetical protein
MPEERARLEAGEGRRWAEGTEAAKRTSSSGEGTQAAQRTEAERRSVRRLRGP